MSKHHLKSGMNVVSTSIVGLLELKSGIDRPLPLPRSLYPASAGVDVGNLGGRWSRSSGPLFHPAGCVASSGWIGNDGFYILRRVIGSQLNSLSRTVRHFSLIPCYVQDGHLLWVS